MMATDHPLSLKLLLRQLPNDLVTRLLTHRVLRLGTPLYAAATGPCETSIDVLLGAGAQLELEGGDEGIALMGTCATGRLAVVKLLVRKGAKTSYVKDGHVYSVLSKARYHPEVTRWLMVGRFTEGPRIIMNV